MEKLKYPGVFVRVKAVFIDTIVVLCFMYLVADLYSSMGYESISVRTTLIILTYLLYEPIAISFFGCTLGHKFNNLRVKREHDEHKNIILPLAVVRHLIKVLLGWVSLITVQSNDKRQAIHDGIVNSVVIYLED